MAVLILAYFKLLLLKFVYKMQIPSGLTFYRFGLIILFVAFISGTSCVSTKKVVYFNDLPDTIPSQIVMGPAAVYEDPKIQPNDNLAVTIQTLATDGNLGDINTPVSSNSSGTFSALNGFLVDKNGYIELKLIGFVKVAGLTTTEARELIKQKAKEFFKDPVVNVRIANFNITVLGDVNRPGAINVPTEKMSIIDAIALSGDLSLTARRDNILLTRIEDNQVKHVRIDLRSSSIFSSPYFYLKQNDKIYVEPNRSKVQSSDNSFVRNLGIISSIVSIASLGLLLRNSTK